MYATNITIVSGNETKSQALLCFEIDLPETGYFLPAGKIVLETTSYWWSKLHVISHVSRLFCVFRRIAFLLKKIYNSLVVIKK